MAKGRRANIIVGAVIAVIAIAAVAAFAWMQLGGAGAPSADAGAGAPGAGLRAIVHDGDGDTRELPLDRNTELTVTTSLGTNVVVVADGAVSVREADCDNQDCVHQGSISTAGRQIICLPHQLWIEIVPEGEAGGQMDVDAVAGGDDGLDVVAR